MAFRGKVTRYVFGKWSWRPVCGVSGEMAACIAYGALVRFWLLPFQCMSLLICLESQWKVTQVSRFLSTTRGSLRKCLAPGFCLAHDWLWSPFGCKLIDGRALSFDPIPFLSYASCSLPLCSYAFSMK